MSDLKTKSKNSAPVPSSEQLAENPGPGKGGPRFGPIGSESGAGILESSAETEAGPANSVAERIWPDREEWELPETYGVDQVVALVRDPWWVFVYWELSEEARAEARKRAGSASKLLLRLSEVSAKATEKVGPRLAEVEVPDIASGDWYVRVEAPRLRVKASMGFQGKDGVFHPVLDSLEVPVPAFEAVPPLEPELEPQPGVVSAPKTPEIELFEHSGGRELADAAKWRKQRSRPVLWKRRQVGRTKLIPGSGSGKGALGMELDFGPPEASQTKQPPRPGPTTEDNLGPLGDQTPSSLRPSSPSSPLGRPSSPGGENA